MNEIVRKTYRAEVKSVDEGTGEVELFIPLSSSEWDRDQEVVEPASIKKHLAKFMKHPILVASHDYRDLTNQIGEWKRIRITDTGTEGKPKYYIGEGNEQADWGFKLASRGMAAFSYGFIPKVWEDGDGIKAPKRTYKEIELLEISQVIVPSNREAIQNIRSKSVDPIVNEICDAVEKEIPEGGIQIPNLVTKPEETESFIHIPAKEQEGKHEGHRIRVIPIDKDKGIQAKYCGECKVITSYMFEREKGWTMEKAKKWVEEHSKSASGISEISQAEILDELDYLIRLVDTKGMNDEVKKDAWNLVGELLRCCGNDIPLFIREMISPKQEIVEPKPEISLEQIEEIISKEIAKAIRKAQGALE